MIERNLAWNASQMKEISFYLCLKNNQVKITRRKTTVLRNVGSFISQEEDDCIKKLRQIYFSGLQVISVKASVQPELLWRAASCYQRNMSVGFPFTC